MKKTASSPSEIEYEASYKKGSSLYQRWFDIGWVELVKRTGRVFYCQHPTDTCYKEMMDQGLTRLRSLLAASKTKQASDLSKDLQNYQRDLGLAIHLASERLQRPWMLPPMARIQNNVIDISTGMSRTAADLMCATPPEEINFIIYVGAQDQVDLNQYFYKTTELNTTEEYANLIGIEDIDYRIRIEMMPDGHPRFVSSIISHTLYDYSTKDEASNFENLGGNFLYRFKGMANDQGQVQIEIRCTEKSAQFIPDSNQQYNVKIVLQPESEWHWSYGRFLSLTNDREVREAGHKVYLLLYDISEPLNLDLILLWFGETSTYQTRDKKLAAFTPGRSGSIKEVGNFVK